MQQEWAGPRPFGGDALGEQNADQERVRRCAEQLVGGFVSRERVAYLGRAQLLELATEQKQRVGYDALLR